MSEKILGSCCPHCGNSIRYQYQMISPIEIIRAKGGVLNLGGFDVTGAQNAKLARQMQNKSIISAYMTDMEKIGWIYKGMILYEGLPYGGNMVFAKVVEFDEEITENPLITEDIKNTEPEETKNTEEKTFKRLRELKEQKNAKREAEENSRKSNTRKPSLPDKVIEEAMISEEETKEEVTMPDILPRPEVKVEKTTAAIQRNPVKEINLFDEYEKEFPGKKATAFGKETKSFENWKIKYIQNLGEED